MSKKNIKWIIAILICLLINIIILVSYLLSVQIRTSKKQELQNRINNEVEQTDTGNIGYTKYNEISYAYISDMQLCNIYLLDYKNNALERTEEAYDSLDEAYRQKRFGSFENYQKYIENHAGTIFNVKLQRYQVNHYDDFTQYICIDQYENEYIFHETAIMKYTVYLDSYTVDLPQYTEKYTTSDETQKVGMSIERFVKAIYEENYDFAYSVLSTGLKENYFKTQQQFEIYVKQNFIKAKEITYITTRQEGDIYIFEANLQNNQNQTMKKTFMVRLGEGTNFELSFEI